MKFYTTYKEAVNWLHNDFVLCNNIEKIDETVYFNTRFNKVDEEGFETEIYQWYITDASLSDVEYLEKHFGLLFTYSELLDCFVLCVDHFGTSWSYVACEVLTYGNEDEFYPHCKSYEELTGLKY